MGALLCCRRNVERIRRVSLHMSEKDEYIHFDTSTLHMSEIDEDIHSDMSHGPLVTECFTELFRRRKTYMDEIVNRSQPKKMVMSDMSDMSDMEETCCTYIPSRHTDVQSNTVGQNAGVSSVEQESDSSSEGETPETLNRQNNDRNKQICDPCFQGQFIKVIAFYMCYVCGKSFCKGCFSGHDNSHGFLSLHSESEQLDREIDEYLSYLKNESVAERNEIIMKNEVCDYVDTKHDEDEPSDITVISGITGYGYKWWVTCDSYKRCIKVFTLSSNMLQRYIRFDTKPEDVTEIIVEKKTTEQDSASCRETAISGTDNKPDRKHLLAVSFPEKCLILILGLDENPAVIHKKIKTEKCCMRMDSYDGNIYVVCKEYSLGYCYSVSIMSPEGVMLKSFQTGIPSSNKYSSLSVLNGNIYMTDEKNQRVVCYNDEGRVMHEIRIYGYGVVLIDICVDRSKNKVYTSSRLDDKVYELESDLSRYKSVIDQTTRYMKRPWAICFYSDKLYVSHYPWSVSGFHVTVVRLL